MVLQGSAATSLRLGGKYNALFVANFVLSLAVKTLWKSITISQSYRHVECRVFFWITVYVHSMLYIILANNGDFVSCNSSYPFDKQWSHLKRHRFCMSTEEAATRATTPVSQLSATGSEDTGVASAQGMKPIVL